MTKFSDLKLDPKVLQAVLDAGYEVPTPIQMGAIPPALEGRDVLGIAQTGTGKTASFVLPMITLLGRGRARARMPRSLVLCPTRELAAQVAENFDTYAKQTRLTKALLIGGVSFGEQDKLIDRGVDVLIATPGRLLDHVERGKLLLTGVQIMVVDEADRMLDMGFIPDIERIFQLTPFTRQTLFFSATMAPEIERITNTFLHSPARVEVARQATTSETITQRLIELTPTRRDLAGKQKRDLLRALIDAEGAALTNAIVFCNRKSDVDILAKSLTKSGYDAAPIHGDLDQSQRTRTLEGFRDGKLRLLIASDVAARGLDIPAVSHVFNYDMPSHAEDYVHRIGRTGRAGRLGTAVTIATPSDDKYLAAIEQLVKQTLPRAPLPEGFALSDAPDGADRARKTDARKPDVPKPGGRDADPRASDDRAPDDRKGGSRTRSRKRRDDDRPGTDTTDTAPQARIAAEMQPEIRAEQPRPIEEPARVEQPRAEHPRRDDRQDRQQDGRRDGGRRGRDQDGRDQGGRRNDGRAQDGRHQVMGMGDHVPQFMLVELRSIGLSDDTPAEAVAEPVTPAETAPATAEAKPARRGRSRGRGKGRVEATVDQASDAQAPDTQADVTPTAPQPEVAAPQDEPAPDAAPQDAPKPKRTRSRKAPVQADLPEGEADSGAEKPKPARKPATRKPAAKKAAAEVPADSATDSPAAPKPATRRRKAADAEAPAPAAADKPKRTRRKKADPAPDDTSAKDAAAEA